MSILRSRNFKWVLPKSPIVRVWVWFLTPDPIWVQILSVLVSSTLGYRSNKYTKAKIGFLILHRVCNTLSIWFNGDICAWAGEGEERWELRQGQERLNYKLWGKKVRSKEEHLVYNILNMYLWDTWCPSLQDRIGFIFLGELNFFFSVILHESCLLIL